MKKLNNKFKINKMRVSMALPRKEDYQKKTKIDKNYENQANKIIANIEQEYENQVYKYLTEMEQGYENKLDLLLKASKEEIKQLKKDNFDSTQVINKYIATQSQEVFLHKKLKESNEIYESAVIIEVTNLVQLNHVHSKKVGDEILKIIKEQLKSLFGADDNKNYITRQGNQFILFLTKIISKKLHERNSIINKSMKSILRHKASLFERNDIKITLGIFNNDNNYEVSKLLEGAKYALLMAKKEPLDSVKNMDFYTCQNKKEFENFETSKKVDDVLLKISNLTIESKDLNILNTNLKQLDEYFEIYYQPQIDLETAEIIGAEALIRMKDEQDLLISPYYFIDKIEDNNQILIIGKWIVKTVYEQVKIWKRNNGMKNLKIGINLSLKQLVPIHNLMKFIVFMEEKTEVIHSNIGYEITESKQLTTDTKETINKLIKKKYEISLDDFGSGYANLEHFGDIKYSIIKIDKSLVQKMENDSSNYIIVNTAIILAKKLGARVLAEGVEVTQDEVTSKKYQYIYRDLRYAKCDLVQGFYFSCPLSKEKFKKYVDDFDPTEECYSELLKTG